MENDLIRQYSRLVYKIARRYSGVCERDRSIDMEDLVQSGYLGLIKAKETYQDNRGASFTTWAVYYIRSAIQIEIRRHGKADLDNISLDSPLSQDEPDGGSLIDTIEDPDAIDPEGSACNNGLREAICRELEKLPEDERRALEYKYMSGLTGTSMIEAAQMTAKEFNSALQKGLRKARHNWRLRELAEIERSTDYYHRVGIDEFMRTRTSAVEAVTLWRLKQEQDRGIDAVGTVSLGSGS